MQGCLPLADEPHAFSHRQASTESANHNGEHLQDLEKKRRTNDNYHRNMLRHTF